ncbi:MAG: CoA-binding protein, partial [Gammaproteobacteria bacterium]|nr:CoA-binding protein [Gammaproteobacteria bacterium]
MPNRDAVREVLAKVQGDGRASLTALEAKQVCDAYGIPVPEEGMATTAALAGDIADEIGYPVVMKIVSPDILHKTDAGGVITGIEGRDAAVAAYDRIVAAARDYDADADVLGVQVQQQMQAAQEVIVGGVTDPSFGKLVAFGLGGILVEVLKDVTFRLAPATEDDAGAMLDEIAGAEVLRGVRGGPGVDRASLAGLIANVSQLISDFPAISEMDLNPVFATPDGVCAVDTRILLDFDPAPPRYRPSHDEILGAMTRIMQPDGVAVIGASAGEGKIGNSVMKNLIDGGYQGEIYPIHPRETEVLGRKCYTSVTEVPGSIDIAIFCIPAALVANALGECGEKNIPGAVLIPSGFAEVGEHELQAEIVKVARENNVRLMGPNIYGFYYTHKNLCATFCTPYGEKGKVALSSQSGGVGMAIVGFSRSAKMGVSAIVGPGPKASQPAVAVV